MKVVKDDGFHVQFGDISLIASSGTDRSFPNILPIMSGSSSGSNQKRVEEAQP